MADDSTDDPVCSKCDGALDTEGYPLWCKKCRATYKREYEALRLNEAEARGFAAGVEAMAKTLQGEFERLGRVQFSGTQAAVAVFHTPRPQFKPAG